MQPPSGDFEIHITGRAEDAEQLRAFAARHGVKFVHIELDRGAGASQPMLTLSGRGDQHEQQSTAQRWEKRLAKAGLAPQRTKVELVPWADGVPQTDVEAWSFPDDRYFEHHVKLLLPAAGEPELAALVTPYGARLSRNARRHRSDGSQERFVTQRCFGFGAETARARLDALVDALREHGTEIVEVEREYVVYDGNPQLDAGWLTAPTIPHWLTAVEARSRSAPAGTFGYPPTYQPLAAGAAVRQTAAFDPAVQHYGFGHRAGEPELLVPEEGRRWRAARRAALLHALTVIAGTRRADHLVLRGSVTIAAWVGEAAREPADLDFVVDAEISSSRSPGAADLLRDIRAALHADPGPGLWPNGITETEIWTYERADGRRLAVPFATPGAPVGHVQIDIVFGEPLPIAPEVLVLPGVDVPVLGAPAPLALAWKLLWLETDSYPQGKDLYDAVLLAEHTAVDLALVRELIGPQAGRYADFSAESVLAWDIDWPNFTDEYPGIPGTLEEWLKRLARALERVWSPTIERGRHHAE